MSYKIGFVNCNGFYMHEEYKSYVEALKRIKELGGLRQVDINGIAWPENRKKVSNDLRKV